MTTKLTLALAGSAATLALAILLILRAASAFHAFAGHPGGAL